MPKKKFDSIESLENWVAWDYFKSVLYWPNDKVAYELDVNERKLIEWIGERGAKMTELAGAQPGKVNATRKDLEERYPVEVVKDPTIPNITIKKVVEMLRDGKQPREIAASVKCPEGDFLLWYGNQNQAVNAEFRKQQNTY